MGILNIFLWFFWLCRFSNNRFGVALGHRQ
jgi:hypothetical protein